LGNERSSPIIIVNTLDVDFFRPKKEAVMGPKGNAKIGRPMEKTTTDTQGKVPIQPNSYKDIVPEIENIPSPDSLLVAVHSTLVKTEVST
jgi:hypothetical protein